MEEKMIISSGKLKGYNRCEFRRSRNIRVKSAKGLENVYEKAVLIKDLIRKGLFKVNTDEEIEAILELNMKEMDYPTEETAKLHAADAYRQIMRYLSCEHRMPEVAEAKVVSPFGLFDVQVKPDFIFRGVREFTYESEAGKSKTKHTLLKKYIEVVKICCRKPDVSLTGKGKDSGMKQRLELYAMLMYARSLVKPGEDVNVCASYYFLRKNNDSSISKEFDPNFFEGKGSGNIVTLWEEYLPELETELDRKFQPQFENFYFGEEVCGDECTGCDFFQLCHYTQPPLKLEDTFSTLTSVHAIKLTDTQREVTEFKQRIACVNAGAGAGKTTSIALRTANLIKETGQPEKICMLTFTNTGAEEMRNRIRSYANELGCDADISKLTSTTFNAFGNDIIKKNYKELGFADVPRLIDDIDRSAIIARILKDHVVDGLDYRNFNTNMKNCRGAFAVAKKAFQVIKSKQLTAADADQLCSEMPPSYLRFIDSNRAIQGLLDLYQEYDETLKKENYIEYADQELLVFELLKKDQDYFEKNGYEHIIVDEFQDTNEIQFELLKRMINTSDFQSFMVVGDDSQSIFAFRGSSPEYIINFFSKLGIAGKQFDMVENYRSTPQIIHFANSINDINKNRVIKDLVAVKPDGDDVSVNIFWKKDQDIEFTVNTIKKEYAAGTPYEDIAYIAFTRAELIKLGTKLTEDNIPWVMLNPEPMLENSRVIAALSLVKFICDPDATKDALIYLNATRKNKLLAEASDDEIIQEISKLDAAVSSLLEASEGTQVAIFIKMLEAANDEDEVYGHLIDTVKNKETFEQMLEYCTLFETYGDDQSYKRMKSYPGVVLTTAHSSKGKEWAVVINSLNNYHTKEIRRNINSPDFEERRRLLFVSATRAKQKLYIVGQAIAYGSKRNEDQTINQFLIESCEVTGTKFPAEPLPEKKTKERRAS